MPENIPEIIEKLLRFVNRQAHLLAFDIYADLSAHAANVAANGGWRKRKLDDLTVFDNVRRMTHHTLREAIHEIRSLRRQNEILRAKVEVIEIFGRATAAVGGGGECMSPDVTYALANEADAMIEAEKEPQKKAEVEQE